jgi:hypothetical protein
MKSNQRRIRLTLGGVAGGLLAAAFLPMAVAFADEFAFTPDPTTLDLTQVEGYPPLINEVTGTEQWNIIDLTTNSQKFADVLNGVDTQTTIGSFTNDDFLVNPPALVGSDIVQSHSQIDLANFGAGFENEWIDIPGNQTGSGISDLLITPFGDFQLLGTLFSDMSAAF